MQKNSNPMLPRAVINELNELSRDVFGASSRWRKMIYPGVAEIVMEDVKELVPRNDDSGESDEQDVQVPVKRRDGAMISVIKHHTADSIRDYMINRKAELDNLRANMEALQVEAKVKKEQEELEKKVHADLVGSAVNV